MWFWIVISFLLVCYGIICVIWRIKNPNSPREPPELPNALPFLGHSYLLFGDSFSLWKTSVNVAEEVTKMGGVASVYAGPRTAYIITDPDDCHTVANTCIQKDVDVHFTKSFLGEGLLTADVPKWHRDRAILNRALEQHLLDNYIGVFNRQARKLANTLEQGINNGFYDSFLDVQQNAFETIVHTAMGSNFTESDNRLSVYFTAMKKYLSFLSTRFNRIWLHMDYFFHHSQLKQDQKVTVEMLHSMTYFMVQEREERMLQINPQPSAPGPRIQPAHRQETPIVDVLLDLSIRENTFTNQEIQEHIDTMIFAGFEPFSTMLLLILVFLGSHPKMQENVYREIKKEFRKRNSDVTNESISRLVYLQAFVKEAMRMYPMHPIVARRTHKEIKLKRCTLAANRTCFLSYYGVNRHTAWGSSREIFFPSRWLSPSTLPPTLHAFATFGLGKRSCLGKNYMFMAITITTVHILRKLIIYNDSKNLRLKLEGVIKVVQGHYLSFKKRGRS